MHHFDKRDLRNRTAGYFHHALSVRFQDVDAAGIVFFARVLDYVHDAYVGLLAELGSDLPSVLRERRWAAPLRHVEADYFEPLRFGDRITVAVVAAHVAETEIALGWQILRRDGVAAVAQTVHVFVDARSFERCAVPEPFAPLSTWT